MSLNFPSLAKRLFRRFTKKAPTPSLKRFRPMLEACEDRTTPTPVVTAAVLAHANEGDMMAMAVARLTRTETAGGLTVNYSLGGTAAGGGTDYYTPVTPLTFLDGQATADVQFMLNNDSASEPTETIILTVTSGTGYTIGSSASATLNVYDNDAQVVSVYATQDAAEGGDPGVLLFFRTGDLSASLTANFSVGGGGTATSGTDYTSIGTSVAFAAGAAWAEKLVVPLADNVVEATDESVVVTVTSGTGYTVGSPSSGTVYIADDPPVIAVEASDTAEGSATGGFSFTRSGGNLAAALTVSYSVSGTATSGTDYTALSGSVTFDEDQDRVEVWVEAFGDNAVDDGETVTATLDDGGDDYTLGDDEATVTIADQPLTVSVIALSDGVEGGTNPVFRFTRYGDLSEELVVDYTVGGTATSGTDFTALAGSVTFAEDDDEVDVTVYLSGDVSSEDTETVTVTLDEVEGYLFGNDADTAFITDNDTRRVVWTGAVDGDWDVSGNWETVGNSSEHDVPDENDEVYFDGNVSDDDCTNLGEGEADVTFKGVHFVNGYAGTVTLAAPLFVNTYVQESGTLDQPDEDYDLTVSKVMLWTGGTLNSTEELATVTITGSTATARFAPAEGGTVNRGSNISLAGGAVLTMKEGTVNGTNDGMEFYIGEDCGMRVDPGQKKRAEYTINTNVTVEEKMVIDADGYLTVLTGDFATKGECKNEGGILTLQTGTSAYFPGANNVWGYQQLVGSELYLWNGSKLKSIARVEIMGGYLITLGEEGRACSVQIECSTMVVRDANIWLARDPTDSETHLSYTFGELFVSGAVSVNWESGVFQAYVPAEHNGAQGDWWRSAGEIKIGTATTQPTLQVVAWDDESNSVTPTTGYEWNVMESKVEIKLINEAGPNLPPAWAELVQTPLNEPKKTQWFVKAK